MAESWDPNTRATVQKIPLLTVKAGPRDKEEWQKRLKEVGRRYMRAWLACLQAPRTPQRQLCWSSPEC